MKRSVCAIAASSLLAVLQPTQALAQDRTPVSPWSRLFMVPTDRVQPPAVTPSINVLAQAPTVIRPGHARPCTRIASKPVDPAFDASIRRAAPTRPAPSSRSLPVRACQQPE